MRELSEVLSEIWSESRVEEGGSESLPVHRKQKVFTALNQEIILLLQGFLKGPRATGMSQGKEAQGVI